MEAVTDSANWSTFDLGTLFPGAKGYASSVFDGKYLDLIPNNNGAPDGVVTRYDTTGGFGASSSWSTFDVSTVNPSAKGFQGGAFDGKFVPYNNGAYNGVAVRFDTTAATFGGSDAWATFDLASVDPNALGYVRSLYDGRYLYLVPHYNGAYHGSVARYDTQSPAGFTGVTSRRSTHSCDRASPTFFEAALVDTPVINLVSTTSPLTIPAGILQRGHTTRSSRSAVRVATPAPQRVTSSRRRCRHRSRKRPAPCSPSPRSAAVS